MLNSSPLLLVYGLDLEGPVHRGIATYAKAMIRLLADLGYPLHLLTGAGSLPASPLTELALHRHLDHPSVWSRLQLVRAYFKDRLGFEKAVKVPVNLDFSNGDRLNYLQHVQLLRNQRLFYRKLRLQAKLSDKPFKLDTRNYPVVLTSSPLNLRVSKNSKLIQVIHDLIPLNYLRHPDEAESFLRRLKSTAEYSDRILCISDSTRQQFLELFSQAESRTETLYQPVSFSATALALANRPDYAQSVLRKYRLESDRYFFFVGAIEPRKNLETLIAAQRIAVIQTQLPLVIGGTADVHTKDYSQSLAQQTRPEDQVIWTGYLSEAEKICLLRHCRSLTLLSWQEGFGIPIIEAALCGRSSLLADIPIFREVMGDAAVYAKPDELLSVADALIQIGQYPAQLTHLRSQVVQQAELFSTQQVKQNLHKVLQSMQ
ncbi:glycosyltransferase family 1 protein [Synechococcus elongatus]|uniref:glycosyltransferase family 4 protein n=1 Tax=Synechococcus elongatus TaxID=32046 RepID=UPI0030D0545E